MTTQEIQTKFNQMVSDHSGRAWEVEDASNLDQCFDLALGWCDYLAIPRATIEHLNAVEIWTKPFDVTLQYFDYIPNTANGIPQKGDMLVFSGKIGHVSTASGKGDSNSFESFDQNWDTTNYHDADGHPICRFVNHNYAEVLGWLRPKAKVSVPSDNVVLTDQTKVDMGEGFGVMEIQAVRSTLHDLKRDRDGNFAQANDLKNQFTESQKQLKNSQDLYTKLSIDCTAQGIELEKLKSSSPVSPDSLSASTLFLLLLKKLFPAQ